MFLGFDFPREEALDPTDSTNQWVQMQRNQAVDVLTGDTPVAGLAAADLRESELLPENGVEADGLLSPWRGLRFYRGDETLAQSVMLGFAVSLGRGLVVFERQRVGKDFYTTAKVFGKREEDGSLALIEGSIPTYHAMPLDHALALIRQHPSAYSVLEFDGIQHYDFWTPRRLLEATGERAGDAEPEAADEAADETACGAAGEAAGRPGLVEGSDRFVNAAKAVLKVSPTQIMHASRLSVSALGFWLSVSALNSHLTLTLLTLLFLTGIWKRFHRYECEFGPVRRRRTQLHRILSHLPRDKTDQDGGACLLRVRSPSARLKDGA